MTQGPKNCCDTENPSRGWPLTNNQKAHLTLLKIKRARLSDYFSNGLDPLANTGGNLKSQGGNRSPKGPHEIQDIRESFDFGPSWSLGTNLGPVPHTHLCHSVPQGQDSKPKCLAKWPKGLLQWASSWPWRWFSFSSSTVEPLSLWLQV